MTFRLFFLFVNIYDMYDFLWFISNPKAYIIFSIIEFGIFCFQKSYLLCPLLRVLGLVIIFVTIINNTSCSSFARCFIAVTVIKKDISNNNIMTAKLAHCLWMFC